MALHIINEDITTLKVDAIVNAANRTLLGGGGVDGAIHRAAGAGLLEACRQLSGCATGQAVITEGFNLAADYVIHTVGPIWQGGQQREAELLKSCYQSCLTLASQQGLNSLAFPLISAGAYGYPLKAAFRIAVDVVQAYLEQHKLEVYLVIYGQADFVMLNTYYNSIKEEV